MRRSLHHVLAFLVVALGSTGGSASLLLNPSFEADLEHAIPPAAPDYWSASGNMAIRSNSPITGGDGLFHLRFSNGNLAPNGVIAQSFSTTTGTTYLLEYLVGRIGSGGLELAVEIFDTAVGDSVLLFSEVLNVDGVQQQLEFYSMGRTFVAAGANTTIRFRDTSSSTNNKDVILDHVVVVAYGSGPGEEGLYGANGNNMWEIDAATGSGTTITLTADFNVNGLAFDSANRELYGVNGNNLWRIDTTTGASVLVTGTGSFGADALAFNPNDGFLYGANSSSLWKIAPATGASTVITTNGDFSLTGLAFNTDDGFLYGGVGNNLWRIDHTSGESVQVTGGGGFNLTGLAFNEEDGYLYAGTGNNLYRVSPGTGASELVTGSAIYNVSGLAIAGSAVELPALSRWGLMSFLAAVVATALATIRFSPRAPRSPQRAV